MRYLLTLLAILAIVVAAPIPIAGGPLTKPPKLDKMLKPPKKPKPPGESYSGKQCTSGHKLLHHGG